MKKSILTTIVLTILGFGAFAQFSTTASHNVVVNASSVLDVQMTSSAAVVFNFATTTDYEGGITKPAAAELQVKSTRPWTIVVGSADANFTSGTGTNNSELSRGALEVRKTGGSFAAMSTSGTVATGNKGGIGVNGNTFTIDYKLAPGYFAQDTYTLPVVYTISQN